MCGFSQYLRQIDSDGRAGTLECIIQRRGALMSPAIDAARPSDSVDVSGDRSACRTQTIGESEVAGRIDQWRIFASSRGDSVFQDPAWLLVLQQGLKHTPMAIEGRIDDRLVGSLPLALVDSRIFGR